MLKLLTQCAGLGSVSGSRLKPEVRWQMTLLRFSETESSVPAQSGEKKMMQWWFCWWNLFLCCFLLIFIYCKAVHTSYILKCLFAYLSVVEKKLIGQRWTICTHTHTDREKERERETTSSSIFLMPDIEHFLCVNERAVGEVGAMSLWQWLLFYSLTIKDEFYTRSSTDTHS